MRKLLLISVSGEKKIITPEVGKTFKYPELKKLIGGIISMSPLPSGRTLICHDEGKLIGLPVNEVASALYRKEYPIEEYPYNNDGFLVGDILISGRNLEALL